MIHCPTSMWELDHQEDWVQKNWCFPIVVLEKALESPFDSKKIKLVNPKGNQPWIMIGRTNAEAEAPIVWPPDAKEPTHLLLPTYSSVLNLSQHQGFFFPMSQLFASGGQGIRASASALVLPVNILGWFPLGLTDLLFKWLSRVFSCTKTWKHQFFTLSLFYGPTLTSSTWLL